MNYEQFKHLDKNIFLVDMSKEINHHFSQLTLKGLEKYIKEKKRIGIIVNKKGYSNGTICKQCGSIPQCKRCSVSINYHKIQNGELIGICHICKTQYNFPTRCEDCGGENIKEFGIGTQKIAEFIKNEYNINPIIIESEKVNSANKIKKTLDYLKSSESSKIIIGTSLLTTQIKDINFDLILFLNADLGLSIPDYTSSEKNFYFLYEAFIKQNCNNFIVQSFNPNNYSIHNACKLDKEGFYEVDNQFRKDNNYPPFQDMCIILYKNEIEDRLFTKVDKLYKELLYLKEKYEMNNLEIYSTPPLIYKMFGKYRYNIILKGPELRNFMDIVYTKLNLNAKGFKINRQAESIV